LILLTHDRVSHHQVKTHLIYILILSRRDRISRSQKVQTEKIVIYYLTLLLQFLLLRLFLLQLPGTDNRLLLLNLLSFVGILLNKIAYLRFGVIVVSRIHKDGPILFLLERHRIGDSDKPKQNLQNFAIILDIILRLWKGAQLVDMGFEIAQKFLIFLHQKLDSIERLGLDLKIIIHF